MSEEIKQSMEELKETIAALAKTVKDESDNRQKQENIIADLQKKAEKYEKISTR